MRRIQGFLGRAEAVCALWIAICFSLTSAAYLSWTYHLLTFAAPDRVDVYCLILGYAFQAAGLGAGYFLFRKTAAVLDGKLFCICTLIFCVSALPALMGNTLTGSLIFGFLMNVLCGVLSGFYLCYLAMRLRPKARGKAFGFGYGISTVFVFLLSLPGDHHFLQSQDMFIAVLLLAAAAVWIAFRLFRRGEDEKEKASPPARAVPSGTVALAAGAVFLLSLVKNMGFNFPATDISAGTNLELSRLFYAVGLVAAGVMSDRNRKYGAFCMMAGLTLPFVMLALSGESLPALICWGLDYLFYGFFSVFRAVLFMDIAAESEKWPLAAVGLMAGRAGDALGTALYMLFSFSKLLLICAALVLFLLTLFVFMRLCQRVYMPEATQEKSEREVFESFAIQHDLSAREREVLRLVLSEQSVPQIAETLFVTESTVRYHVHHLLQKSGCKSRQELVNQYNMMLYPHISPKNQSKAN